MSNPIAPYKGRDPEPIINAALQIYEDGKEIEDAARELAVPARTIYRWLSTNAVDRWHEAQKGRALADFESARKRRDEARLTLEGLKQTLSEEQVNEPAERNWRLTHAREVLRAADTELDHQKWLLERLIKRIYGQDQHANTGQAVVINIDFGAAKTTPSDGQVIDIPAERN